MTKTVRKGSKLVSDLMEAQRSYTESGHRSEEFKQLLESEAIILKYIATLVSENTALKESQRHTPASKRSKLLRLSIVRVGNFIRKFLTRSLNKTYVRKGEGEWLPFPENEPSEDGEYLVTRLNAYGKSVESYRRWNRDHWKVMRVVAYRRISPYWPHHADGRDGRVFIPDYKRAEAFSRCVFCGRLAHRFSNISFEERYKSTLLCEKCQKLLDKRK